ncbi:aldose reductase [Neurospora intermedia]|uniref:Aldose reductase n=1 Tax=Neurospora intermedia TaxID=5142 RepID=A0ABR3DHQ9_NEUIN
MLPVSRAIPRIPSITNTTRHFFSQTNTMAPLSKTHKLNTGDEIPAVGLGTWQSKPGQVEKAVEAALRAGYTHIDTAYAYGNEKEVGQGIKASGVPREKIWLTTKLDNDWHKHVAEAIDTSLKNLDTPYVDLYLMHWPASLVKGNTKEVYNDWDFVDTWREMQKLVDTGKVKNIGVSNFGVKNLEKLLSAESTKIVPAVNQIELHPGNPSPHLVEYLRSKGIHASAYSPLGSSDSPLYKLNSLTKLAESKGKTVQQVLLRWGVQKGWSVLPKSVTEERIKANIDLEGWSLTDEEIAQIDEVHKENSFKVCGDDWLPVKIFFGAGDSD